MHVIPRRIQRIDIYRLVVVASLLIEVLRDDIFGEGIGVLLGREDRLEWITCLRRSDWYYFVRYSFGWRRVYRKEVLTVSSLSL